MKNTQPSLLAADYRQSDAYGAQSDPARPQFSTSYMLLDLLILLVSLGFCAALHWLAG